jgi:xylan 1,4-beta-xylosidase
MLFRQKMKQLDLPVENIAVAIETDKKPQKILLERIDETHCNPLKMWEDDGRPADLTPAQVSNYIERSRLKEETMNYTFSDGVIRFTASLQVNDVYFVRVIW